MQSLVQSLMHERGFAIACMVKHADAICASLHLHVIAIGALLNVCDVSAVVKLDSKTDFSKLKVLQLKQLLEDRGIDDRDCLEKQDYVAKLRQLVQASA